MKVLNKSNQASWLILGILGLVLILGRNAFKNILYVLVGIGLIVAAAAGLAGWWQNQKTDRRGRINLAACAAMLIAGIWFVTHPKAIDTLLNVLIGLALVIFGIVWILQARNPRDNVTLYLGIGAVVRRRFTLRRSSASLRRRSVSRA